MRDGAASGALGCVYIIWNKELHDGPTIVNAGVASLSVGKPSVPPRRGASLVCGPTFARLSQLSSSPLSTSSQTK